jgi:hypothetical protein
MVANMTRVPKNHPGRVLALVLQTHNLFPETGQEVLMTEMIAHPRDERMTAIVLLIIGLIIHLMKRGEDLTLITHSHAMTHVTVTTIGIGTIIITITQAEVAPIGLSQDLQDLPRTNLWTARAQATGSLMTLIIVALIPVTVTPHLLEMTTLAVFYEGMIILLMILLAKVLEIMMIRLVVMLEQQSVPGIPNPSMGAPPWSRGILTPRIRVQVDHRL